MLPTLLRMTWSLSTSPASFCTTLLPLTQNIPAIRALFEPFVCARLMPSSGPLHESFSCPGKLCVLLQLVYTFSSLSEIICIDYYENSRRGTKSILGGRQGRFPKSWAFNLIHKGAGAGEGRRESIHSKET